MNSSPGPSGLLVVDKPAGPTSHDVVAVVRRLASTRKVGHAGTLDPPATGVLVLGVGSATRLLGHLALADKEYTATVRLGVATVTDDALGERTGGASAAGVDPAQLRSAVRALTGDLLQVPSAVSAVKVAGVRSYTRVRNGTQVELAPRAVTVDMFEILQVRRPEADVLDLDVAIVCSTGTYVRALARDLGAALGVGGHVLALRRTRVGSFDLSQARTLDQLGERFELVPLAQAVAAHFGRLDVDPAAAVAVRHGGAVALPAGTVPDPVGLFGPDGRLLALAGVRDGALRPLAVFEPA